MLTTAPSVTLPQAHQSVLAKNSVGARRVLTFEKNERMGGSIPVWKTVKATKEPLNNGLNKDLSHSPLSRSAAKISLAPHSDVRNETALSSKEEPGEFGFGDLLDIINPLHHVPLIGDLYRSISGDQIQAAPRIMGGLLFGGPLGGGSALANVIVEYETGTDIAGNLLSTISGEELTLSFKDSKTNTPEQALNKAIKGVSQPQQDPFPANIMSFVDLGHGKRRVYEKVLSDDDRIAGSMIHVHEQVEHHGIGLKEPITQVIFDLE